MPRLIITEGAVQGMEYCRQFLKEKNPLAAVKASQAIEKQMSLLEINGDIGRPDPETPELRELIIPFGDSGYTALYHYDTEANAVLILAFRHQKEAGY